MTPSFDEAINMEGETFLETRGVLTVSVIV